METFLFLPKRLFLFCCFLACKGLFAQVGVEKNTLPEDTLIYKGRDFFPYLGYVYNWNGHHLVEGGIGFFVFEQVGYHWVSAGTSLSAEMRFNRWNQYMIAPKASVWLSGGASPFAMGISTLYYRTPDDGTWVLRPELGWGMLHFRWVYGYNLFLGDKENLGLAPHTLSLMIPLKKVKGME